MDAHEAMDFVHGQHVVEFINGDSKNVDIRQVVIDTRGHPIYLESQAGAKYNWNAVLSIKKIGV